jgi:hypothetical protein
MAGKFNETRMPKCVNHSSPPWPWPAFLLRLAENKADALDAAADNTSGAAEQSLEAQADATRAAGDAKEEAIDDADVNAHAMSNEQKSAIVNGQ